MGARYISHKEEVLSALKQAIETGLEICGGKAESYAAEACPVDTGRLRASITHAPEGENSEIIGTDVEYAPYVELGTRKMSERPYLKPALDNHASEYNDVFKQMLG